MKNNRKKRLIIAILLLSAAAIGVTLGFMFKKADTVNTFTPATVSCSVSEKLDGVETAGTSAVGDEKSDIKVKNTGNINEFLRLKLVSYFVDEDGNISGSEPSSYPDITLNDKWIAGSEHTYYYSEPIEPGSFTPELCSPFSLKKTVSYDGKTLFQVVQVFAEAIQAQPDEAATEAWNVIITDGVITAVQ